MDVAGVKRARFFSLSAELGGEFGVPMFNPHEGGVIGTPGKADLLATGDVDHFLVTQTFADACAGMTGVRFEEFTDADTSRFGTLYHLVVEGFFPYNYDEHTSPDDYTDDLAISYWPEAFGGPVWTYRDYRPAPDGALVTDFFRNGQYPTIWVSEHAATRLREADLKNVGLHPTTDRTIPLHGPEIEARLTPRSG